MGSSSPIFGVKIKNIWNHHLGPVWNLTITRYTDTLPKNWQLTYIAPKNWGFPIGMSTDHSQDSGTHRMSFWTYATCSFSEELSLRFQFWNPLSSRLPDPIFWTSTTVTVALFDLPNPAQIKKSSHWRWPPISRRLLAMPRQQLFFGCTLMYSVLPSLQSASTPRRLLPEIDTVTWVSRKVSWFF